MACPLTAATVVAALDTAAYGGSKARQRDADLKRVSALMEKEDLENDLRGKNG